MRVCIVGIMIDRSFQGFSHLFLFTFKFITGTLGHNAFEAKLLVLKKHI